MDKGTWFQLHPDRILTQINRVPDQSLRGDLLLIGIHALAEGGLAQEPEEIAWVTGLTEERVKQLLPYLHRLQDSEWNGRTMPNFAAEMVREQIQYREQKALAGKRSAERRKQSSTELPPSSDDQPPETDATPFNDAEQRSTPSSNVQPDKQTDRQTDRQTNKNNPRAGSELTDQLSATLCELLRIPDSAGWQLRDNVQAVALELAGINATDAELRAFWAYRRKKPALNYVASEFASWRASNGAEVIQHPAAVRCAKCRDRGIVGTPNGPKDCPNCSGGNHARRTA